MIRKIIHIDEEKCNGCGLCARACHESAIGMVDGKAKLLREDYCDGLGDCLPACPTNAISFVEREAAAYDEAAVLENKKKLEAASAAPAHTGCPGSMAKLLHRGNAAQAKSSSLFGSRSNSSQNTPVSNQQFSSDKNMTAGIQPGCNMPAESQLQQWPVQIKLVPVNAPYFDGAHLLIAADCTAYAYANFHQDFIKGKITLIGCPKLDSIDYSQKLTEIIRQNDIKSVTIVRMEVPCCGGIQQAAVNAMKASGKFLPWQCIPFPRMEEFCPDTHQDSPLFLKLNILNLNMPE